MSVDYDAMPDIRRFWAMCSEPHRTLEEMMSAYKGLCYAVANTTSTVARELFEGVTINFERRMAAGVWRTHQ